MRFIKLFKKNSILIAIISFMTFTACSNDREEAAGKSEKEITDFFFSGSIISEDEDSTLNQPATRAKVDDNKKFIWEQGDKVSIFSHATYYISTAVAQETGAITHFVGPILGKAGDPISMFYPAINGTTVMRSNVFGVLNLNIETQKGTLDYIANKLAFKFGHGSVSSVSGNTAHVSATLHEQTALCNCKFTFMLNGKTMKVKKMYITGAASRSSINLNTKKPDGDLTLQHSTETDKIDITPDAPADMMYVVLFPTAKKEETYTITVTGADGKSYTSTQKMTLEAGKYYSFTLNLGGEQPPYIECDGVKWAKSNFVVLDPCRPWCQSSYGFYKRPWSSNLTKQCVYDTFRWGVIGDAAWNPNCYYCPPSGNKEISGKMYIDPQMRCETKDFRKARYGDIVYWATCGQYRLPTAEEMTKLFTVRSWEYGKHAERCRRPAYGFMFTCPQRGARTTRYDYYCPTRFSWWDFEDGVFLPFASYMTPDGCWNWNSGACVSKYMTSTLDHGCVDAWRFGHEINTRGCERDWKTHKQCDAHTLRAKYSPAEFVPIRAVYVGK